MDKIYKGLEGLEVYKSARLFSKKISELVKTFPKLEDYLLKNQLMRSSRSITANIAEGYGRLHYKEFIQFCRQARGALNQTMEHLICAFDENLISEVDLSGLRTDFQNVLRLLNGFISYLQKQQTQNSQKGVTPSTTISSNTTNTTL